MSNLFESIFGSIKNYEAFCAAGTQQVAAGSTSPPRYPVIDVTCVKCQAVTRPYRLTYKRSLLGRREWLETTCERCSRVLRIPTLDKQAPRPGAGKE